MKKIDRLLLVIFSLLLSCPSCSDDDYVTPPIVSEKYVFLTKSVGTSETLSLYARASNQAGGVNIGGNFIKNEELEGALEQLVSLNTTIMNFVNHLNYIDFVSDQNLVISYRDSNGQEVVIPDMIKEDGSCAKGLKYRKTFSTLHFRFSEKLARFLKLQDLGELPPSGTFTHRTDAKGFLIYLNKRAILYYLDMAKTLGLDWVEIKLIREIVAQYPILEDTLEIGVYLKKID